MARLQILELPSTTDEMYPFALVVDGASTQEQELCNDAWRTFGKEIGARSVLINSRSLDIPRTLTVTEADSGATMDFAGPQFNMAVHDAMSRNLKNVMRSQGIYF